MSIFAAIGRNAAQAFTKSAIVLALACALGATGVQAASESSEKPTEAQGAVGPDPTESASNPLSDAGTSGYHLFRRHCQSCHGYLGVGTKEASALAGSKYAKEHANRKAFHQAFRYASRQHGAVARGTRKRPGPRFNDIELIGKFLREIEAWHEMLEKVHTN